MLKSEIYDFVICRGGTDMCFVLGFGRKRPDLKQYRISGLTLGLGTYEDACQELPHTWFDYLDGYPDFLCRLELYLAESIRFGRGRNFYVNHAWCCHKAT